MNTHFDIWMIADWNHGKPHYPSYEADERKIGSATSLESAERLVAEAAGKYIHCNVHHFLVKEVPSDALIEDFQSISEYTFDKDGRFIDSMWVTSADIGIGQTVFEGRRPDQIRFKPGDIVEIYSGKHVSAAVVVGVPPAVEDVHHNPSNGQQYCMDFCDDAYTLIVGPYNSEVEYQPTEVFALQHRMHPKVKERIMRAYRDYNTAPIRQMIMDTAGREALLAAAEELGWSCTVTLPEYGGPFTLDIENYGTAREHKTVEIRCDRVYDHMDRVRAALFRLAGRKTEVRSFKVETYQYPWEDKRTVLRI